MMNPAPPEPDELTIHVKNNGKPKLIFIDAAGKINKVKLNEGDEIA